MKAKAWRLYGAKDARLEDIELESAGEDGIVVEIITNTICLSDYKGATLGTGHKRVPKDIATRPTMFGHEVSGIVREVGEKWKGQFHVGQHVGLQPSLNIPGHELETVGYAWHLPVDMEDFLDGELVLQIRKKSGTNVMIDRVILMPNAE